MTNKEYIKLTKQLVAKKNNDCRRYLKEQKEEIKKEIIGEIEKMNKNFKKIIKHI